MRKFTKNDVNLDSCDFCGGLWLDNGEIDKLINLSKLTENKSIAKTQSVKSIKKVQSKKTKSLGGNKK
jgi:Zn-finger nucleic acid-binding protein